MKLTLAVLADYVSNENGKLFIIGTFDAINTTQFPAVLPQAGLAVKLQLSHGEAREHTVTISVRDEDGQVIAPQINGQLQIGDARLKGAAPTAQIAMNIGGLRFPKAGAYEFEIVVDGRHLESVPFHVALAGPAAQAA
jgi:hypothetical protein